MDIRGMMKQAQAMQAKMQAAQAELEAAEVEGAAGGGMVRVTATAKGQVKNVSIDDSLMKPEEKISRICFSPRSRTRAARPNASPRRR